MTVSAEEVANLIKETEAKKITLSRSIISLDWKK